MQWDSAVQVFAFCTETSREAVENIIRVSDGVILDAAQWDTTQISLPEIINRCCPERKTSVPFGLVGRNSAVWHKYW